MLSLIAGKGISSVKVFLSNTLNTRKQDCFIIQGERSSPPTDDITQGAVMLHF